MARYEVVYSKRGYPASVWCNTVTQATDKTKGLESIGYTVTIWEHTKQGAKPYGKSLAECFGI